MSNNYYFVSKAWRNVKLENKLKLLVYKANKFDLTINDYFDLKYGINNHKEIVNNINSLTNIKYDQRLTTNRSLDYSINVPLPKFDLQDTNNFFLIFKTIQQFSNLKRNRY